MAKVVLPRGVKTKIGTIILYVKDIVAFSNDLAENFEDATRDYCT